MEDYKEKYEMALEGIQEILSSGQDSIKMPQLQLRLQGIFPELKESEDEKIREMLIDSFTRADMGGEIYGKGVTYKQVIAWLEKQGEQKPIMNVPTREVILSIWDLGNEWKELTNGSISTEYGTQLDYIQKHWYESEYYLREKQGEQKPPVIDFNANDWYVSKVDGKIHNIYYSVDKIEQKPTSDTRYEVKAGGSLSVNGKPFDYEHATITQKDFAQKDYQDIDPHFGISVEDLMSKENSADKVEPIFSIGDVLCDKSCTTLNKKYQPIIEILDIRNGMYICNNCSFPISQQDEYELVTKKNEPQYAWSDEDESIAESIEGALEGYEGMVSEDWEKEKDWLKSLKNKMQPQIKEWSDEDDYNLQCIIDKVNYDIQKGNVGRNNELIDWLKSIKDRATWKPSEEQMEIFKDLIDDNDQRFFYPTLKSLYNDLKKLKEK